MARGLAFAAAVLALAGCAGGDGNEPTSAAVCDDAAFRGQDEELYVAQATISNVIGGGGEAATLLRDLRRGRAALGDYLAAHPPCADALKAIAAREAEAVTELDEAIAALDRGADATPRLGKALELLRSAQSTLTASR